MVRLLNERVLVIGDAQRDVQAALAEAVPGAQITSVATLFDGIAELSGGHFTTVLASAEPLERRPEAAVRTLRELAGDARLLLFGHPTLEILSRKMMEFGCDDYVVTPPNPSEFQQIFGMPPLRIAGSSSEVGEDSPSEPRVESSEALSGRLLQLPLAELLLDAMLEHPAEAVESAVKAIAARVGPELNLAYAKSNQPAPIPAEGSKLFTTSVFSGTEAAGNLYLIVPAGEDDAAAHEAASEVGRLIGKVAALQERHNRLQRLAITDELTGLSNARYFRHFLSLILDRARKMHFPVTLLLFDIDNFKKYNDQFGHATGDDILKQVAALMRRCSRQHDLVARIGGDEFAVVFWDKDGPRQPRQPKPGASYRPPQEPLQVFERFKGLISSEEFPLLGQTGRGSLTVSAGLAVFPWDANGVDALIEEADKRLMMGAKRNGKNTVQIVGTGERQP
jgi:GGDEF domain-containing protein